MNTISSAWEVPMRSDSRTTAGLAPCVGAHFAILIACAWWLIMPDMKWMSAAVYGSRTLSARARAIAASAPIAPVGNPVAGSTRPLLQASKTVSPISESLEATQHICAILRANRGSVEYLASHIVNAESAHIDSNLSPILEFACVATWESAFSSSHSQRARHRQFGARRLRGHPSQRFRFLRWTPQPGRSAEPYSRAFSRLETECSGPKQVSARQRRRRLSMSATGHRRSRSSSRSEEHTSE